MPRRVPPLTQRQVDLAKPRPAPYRLFDGRGLYLEVTPSGGKLWRLKYRYLGREKLLALGRFPETTLAEAREKREAARRLVAQGINPSEQRKAERSAARAAGDTFEAVAREWFGKQEPAWASSHADRVIRRLERDIFPHLGARPVGEVAAPEILAALRRIEARAPETAHRAMQNIGQVMRFAVATGRAPRNPAADLRGALAPAIERHFAAITDPAELGALLRALDAYAGQPSTMYALRLAPLVFVRPGELRHAEWSEIDLESATWTIPAAKVKASTQDHIVPLSRQAVAILQDAEPLSRGSCFAFPSTRTRERPISDMTLGAALRRLGYDGETVTVHGFRATARTLLAEVLGYPEHVIEHQLAHKVRDPLGRAYNRTSFLDERRGMMQRWADYLDELRAGDGAKVLALRSAR